MAIVSDSNETEMEEWSKGLPPALGYDYYTTDGTRMITHMICQTLQLPIKTSRRQNELLQFVIIFEGASLIQLCWKRGHWNKVWCWLNKQPVCLCPLTWDQIKRKALFLLFKKTDSAFNQSVTILVLKLLLERFIQALSAETPYSCEWSDLAELTERLQQLR